jgi:hypothetical protein
MTSTERNSLVTLDVDVEAELAAKYSVSLRSLLLVLISTSYIRTNEQVSKFAR